MDSSSSIYAYTATMPSDTGGSHYSLPGIYVLPSKPVFDLGDVASKRELSRLALDYAVWEDRLRPRPPPPELGARRGYQDGPRLPCYRAVRRR